MIKTTFGAEIEKPIANSHTGNPHTVSQSFFKRLQKRAKERKTFQSYHLSDVQKNVLLGTVSTDLGEQGVDNGWTLLETALPYTYSLKELHKIQRMDLKIIQEELQSEGAGVINMSINPLITRTQSAYKKYVAPKGIYQYIQYRGWDHSAGIDARAQNSPTTGIAVSDAADAVSVIIGAGAAFIALFANSPFEEGRRSNAKESRLLMWERMMNNSVVPGDRLTWKFPSGPFHTLADYFNWMFSEKSGVHFVLDTNTTQQYKSMGKSVVILKEQPSLSRYLSKKKWEGVRLSEVNDENPSKVVIAPSASHIELLQFLQFSGARIRFLIKDTDNFPLDQLVTGLSKPKSGMVESVFEKYGKNFYIEGRDPGANFPDRQLQEEGNDSAETTMIGPAALQAGLLKNLKKAKKYIFSIPWSQLGKLRTEAIRNGFEGKTENLTVYEFTRNIVEIASEGLSSHDQKYLSYVNWCLETRKNGADRAIEFVNNQKGSMTKRMQKLIISRMCEI